MSRFYLVVDEPEKYMGFDKQRKHSAIMQATLQREIKATARGMTRREYEQAEGLRQIPTLDEYVGPDKERGFIHLHANDSVTGDMVGVPLECPGNPTLIDGELVLVPAPNCRNCGDPEFAESCKAAGHCPNCGRSHGLAPDATLAKHGLRIAHEDEPEVAAKVRDANEAKRAERERRKALEEKGPIPSEMEDALRTLLDRGTGTIVVGGRELTLKAKP